jgi:hypothetical protein
MKVVRTNHIAKRLVFMGVSTIGLLALAACGGGDETRTPTTAGPLVSVSGADYSFDAPETIAGGRATLRFANKGRESHDLHLMRLNDGVSIHQFFQTFEEGLDAALRLVSDRGHVAAVGPGQTTEASVDLPEGEYVLLCLVTSPDDGVAHALKGMAQPLTVTGAP